MSKEKVAVTFLKSWRGYSAGEVACFGEVAANDLVKGKVAELHKAGKVAAKPAADKPSVAKPSTAKPKPGAAGDGPAPGAGDDTPPADDEPDADSEPKP